MKQLDMFDQMGIGWSPCKVAGEWIRKLWLQQLENSEQQTPAYTFERYVQQMFQNHCGWWNIDYMGYRGIDYSPSGAKLTRLAYQTETVPKREILRYLGAEDREAGRLPALQGKEKA